MKRYSETEQLLDTGNVVLGDLNRAGQTPSHLGGLLLQVVALSRLLAQDLARTGHAEALAGTGVGLVLRHLRLSVSSTSPGVPGDVGMWSGGMGHDHRSDQASI